MSQVVWSGSTLERSDRQVTWKSVPLRSFLTEFIYKEVWKKWLSGWSYLESIRFNFVCFIADILVSQRECLLLLEALLLQDENRKQPHIYKKNTKQNPT
jgi:hypothetical protein